MVKEKKVVIDENAWHLDKRVPIATIAAIFMQAVAFGWMASSMDSRIQALEMFTREIKSARLTERMSVIESASIETGKKFEHIDIQLSRLEDKVDRIADRVGAKK